MKLGTGNLKFGLLIALAALQAFGADVRMTVNPPVISLSETAQIKVEVRDAKRAKAPSFPQVEGLRHSGTRQSSQTSIRNGKIDKSISYSVNVYPQRTGEFTIGPFAYEVDGETKQLVGKLEVVAKAGDASAVQSWDEVVFARITSSRPKTYVQEPFELTLSIYSRTDVHLSGNIDLQGLPETGLTKAEWKEQGDSREQVNGTLYNVRRFKTTLKAMGSGTFDFAPVATVHVVAPQQQQRRRRTPFGFDSFFDRVQTIPIELRVEETAVDVMPLPTVGKPDHFSGAVGRFDFQVTAEPKEVAPGDPMTLQMTIIGEGNYDRILPPALPEDAAFRLFGDAVRQQGNNGVRFEQVISPRDASVLEIPSIGFSYFDSEHGEYRTISSRPIPIEVSATSNNTAQLFVAQEALTVQPADPPFATESDLQKITGWFKKQWKLVRPWLWTIPAAFGAGLILFFAQKLYHYRRKDTVWLRRQQAPKAARKALNQADTARTQNDIRGYYNALWGALTGYFGNRFNLPAGDVTREQVVQTLKGSGLSQDQLEALDRLFTAIELQRYGGSDNGNLPEDAGKLKTELVHLLKQVEKSKF